MHQHGIFSFAALSTPKPGEDLGDDAYAYHGHGLPWAHLALADGCSDSCWAAHWAKTLVGIVTDGSYDVHAAIDMGTSQTEALRNWLAHARQSYSPQPPPTTHRMRQLAEEGDYSTLLYSRLEMRHPGTLTVVTSVVGDTCLFILTPDGLRYSFPIRRSRTFEDPPDLLWSKTGREENESRILGATRVDGPFVVMACTDQLAAWFLRCHEHGRRDDFVSVLAEIVKGLRPLAGLTHAVPDDEYGPIRHTDELTVVLATSDDGLTTATDSPFFALRQAVLEAKRDGEQAVSSVFPP